MEGGKKGVDMGLAVIPGVLIVCSFVMMLTNGRPASQYKYVKIQHETLSGGFISTELIEIPDSGNYILRIQPDSSIAYWDRKSPADVEPSYSYTNGRTFAEDEEIFVKLPPSGFGDYATNYSLILYKADESTSITIPLSKVEDGEGREFRGTIPKEPYRGNAGEGVAVLPWLANLLSFLLTPLFGLTSAEAIAVPVTALGSAGAALGLIPGLAKSNLIQVSDMAVFTAICMCWSGYLSTHVSMMEVLGCREHTGKAILSHTIGGLCAGFAAHWLYVSLSLL